MQTSFYLLTWITGLCALWFIWDVAIKSLILDLFRDRLFELRFELFRLGMTGELPFDSPTYRTIETLICGLLRFGHRVTLLTVFCSKMEQDKAKTRKDFVDVGAQIALQISRLDPEVQCKLTATLEGLRRAILLYAAFTSLFFLAAFLILTIAKVFGRTQPDRAEARFSGVIESEAYRAETGRSLVTTTA